MSIDEAGNMLREEGVAERPDFDSNAPFVRDTSTRSAAGFEYISDLGFFALFSDVQLKTLDVTDCEGAEIVHDMHHPVPPALHGAFDFIWNGSGLDNMFDPGMAMRSTARMLKPYGRVMCMDMETPHFEAYVTFSQAWFIDFFAVNDFADCKVHTLAFDPKKIFRGNYHGFRPNSFEAVSMLFPLGNLKPTFHTNTARISFVIAEANDASAWDKMPIQALYRQENPAYKEAYNRFAASARPIMSFKPDITAYTLSKPRRAEYLGVMRGT